MDQHRRIRWSKATKSISILRLVCNIKQGLDRVKIVLMICSRQRSDRDMPILERYIVMLSMMLPQILRALRLQQLQLNMVVEVQLNHR